MKSMISLATFDLHAVLRNMCGPFSYVQFFFVFKERLDPFASTLNGSICLYFKWIHFFICKFKGQFILFSSQNF